MNNVASSLSLMSAAVLIHGDPPGDHDVVSVSAVLVAPLSLPGHTSGATGWFMRARGRLIRLAVATVVLGAPVRVEPRHAAASCLGRLEHKVVVQTIKRRFDLVISAASSRVVTRSQSTTNDSFTQKHRIRIEVLVACDEQLRHQTLVPWGADHEMHMRGAHVMPLGGPQHGAHWPVGWYPIAHRPHRPEQKKKYREGAET